MNSNFDMTTIIFLAVAAVIFWRLRSVLGTRTGNERPPQDPFQQRPTDQNKDNGQTNSGDNVIRLPSQNDAEEGQAAGEMHPDLVDDIKKNPWSGFADQDSDLAQGFQAVRDADGSFHPKDFLDGAKLAYEMIVLSFASGDKDTLKPLLDDKVFEGFSEAIDSRAARGEKIEMTFVGILDSVIKDAGVEDGDANVTVRFVSELITTTYDESHVAIEGDPNEVTGVTDVWTFSRSVDDKDPNWVVTVTKTE